MPDARETYIIGAIRSRGIIVQRWRIRQGIQTLDPISRALRRTLAVVRRVYNVCAPMNYGKLYLFEGVNGVNRLATKGEKYY